MQPGREPRPWQLLRELLTDPEAVTRQKDAADHQALAACSRSRADRAGAVAQAALHGYERALHALDPWHRRPVQAGEGVLLLAVLAAGANVTNAIELGPPLAGSRLVLATLAINVVWLTLTWLAALAGRERRWTTVVPAAGGAGLLALLLATVHGSQPRRGWPTAWGEDYRSTAYGILLGLLLLALGACAAILIAHIEPVSCFVARHRWHRARASYEVAEERKLADTQAALAARAAWLDLVRSHARETAGEDQDVVEATVALASDLLTYGRPGFPPAMPLAARPGQERASQRTGAAGQPPCTPAVSRPARRPRPRPAWGRGAPGRGRAG